MQEPAFEIASIAYSTCARAGVSGGAGGREIRGARRARARTWCSRPSGEKMVVRES